MEQALKLVLSVEWRWKSLNFDYHDGHFPAHDLNLFNDTVYVPDERWSTSANVNSTTYGNRLWCIYKRPPYGG